MAQSIKRTNGFSIGINVSKENTNQPYNNTTEDKIFSTEDVITLLKAFHLDTVNGQYNKKLLDWCNNWIDYNVKNTIDFETYMNNNNILVK